MEPGQSAPGPRRSPQNLFKATVGSLAFGLLWPQSIRNTQPRPPGLFGCAG